MPLILFGSALLMKLMDRFPVFITIGAALIGYVAGEMVIGDLATHEYVESHLAFLDKYFVAALAGAVIVVVVGKVLGKRKLLTTGSGAQAHPS
jgi:predicted tellurium resistance membrane protein TerC